MASDKEQKSLITQSCTRDILRTHQKSKITRLNCRAKYFNNTTEHSTFKISNFIKLNLEENDETDQR